MLKPEVAVARIMVVFAAAAAVMVLLSLRHVLLTIRGAMVEARQLRQNLVVQQMQHTQVGAAIAILVMRHSMVYV